MRCSSNSDHSLSHLYTVPWAFDRLHTSMLATDDLTSVCAGIRYLTVDSACENLTMRFPNIQTLTLSPGYLPFANNNVRLRHVTTSTISAVPSCIHPRLKTLTLLDISDVVDHPTVYSHIHHLRVETSPIGSQATVAHLTRRFPNLKTLRMPLQSNAQYYDSLDTLLHPDYLPNLYLLKTSWKHDESYCSDVHTWLAANTCMKWSTTQFSACSDGRNLWIAK